MSTEKFGIVIGGMCNRPYIQVDHGTDSFAVDFGTTYSGQYPWTSPL
jgi:hypothetical protein